MSLDLYLAFVAASAVLILIPGPNVALIVANSVAHGTRFGLLTVAGTALAMEAVGLSMSLGAFLAGVLLAESEYRRELETDLEPFKGLLLGLFFMAVGMGLDLNVLREQPLLVLGLSFFVLFLILPLVTVFAEALRKGVGAALAGLSQPDVWAAARLTLLTTAVATPLNAVFGLAAAWCVTRFDFIGKTLLMALIDLPLSVSPVISGLVWVLLFGASGWFAPWLNATGLQIMFTPVAIVLATIIVTLPYVARELIPLMQQQGSDEELAALTLGARPASR